MRPAPPIPEREWPRGGCRVPASILTWCAFAAFGSVAACAVAGAAVDVGRIRIALAEHVPDELAAERERPERDPRGRGSEKIRAFYACGMLGEFPDTPLASPRGETLTATAVVPNL